MRGQVYKCTIVTIDATLYFSASWNLYDNKIAYHTTENCPSNVLFLKYFPIIIAISIGYSISMQCVIRGKSVCFVWSSRNTWMYLNRKYV